jgi:hypothetical protein
MNEAKLGMNDVLALVGTRLCNERDHRRMNRRKQKYHVTAESTGKNLVMAELLRRGFDAELAGASYEKHDMLVWVRDSPPKSIQIKTVHSTPGYVRRASFTERADQVTVYVLLGAETTRPTRFFVVKNSDLAPHFH